jgi:hypothetical protein
MRFRSQGFGAHFEQIAVQSLRRDRNAPQSKRMTNGRRAPEAEIDERIVFHMKLRRDGHHITVTHGRSKQPSHMIARHNRQRRIGEQHLVLQPQAELRHIADEIDMPEAGAKKPIKPPMALCPGEAYVPQPRCGEVCNRHTAELEHLFLRTLSGADNPLGLAV